MNRPIPGSIANRETIIALAAESAVISAQSRIPFDAGLRQSLYEQIEEALLLGIPMSKAQEAEVAATESIAPASYNPWLDKAAG